jgi:hypothetical protein
MRRLITNRKNDADALRSTVEYLTASLKNVNSAEFAGKKPILA